MASPKKVLIAEDEDSIVQSLSFLLGRLNLDLCIAKDGAQTLDMLKSEKPDMIVLDLMMEYFNGFEVLRIIRSEPALADIKVLVLSAKGQEADRQKVMELGADQFISKPYANKDVVEAASTLLGLET